MGGHTLWAFFWVTPLALVAAFLLFVNHLNFAAKLIAWTGVAIPATWSLVLATIEFGPSVLARRRDRRLLRHWVGNVSSIWAYDSMGATHLRLYKAPKVFVDIMGDADAVAVATRWLADSQIKTFESRMLKT